MHWLHHHKWKRHRALTFARWSFSLQYPEYPLRFDHFVHGILKQKRITKSSLIGGLFFSYGNSIRQK